MADGLQRGAREDGVSLVELLVTMLLLAVISAVVSTATISGYKMLRITSAEADGTTDVRVANERLARDVRDARSVVCNPTGTPAALVASDPTCKYHLQLWIDYNSNYKQETNETVTWSLVGSTVAGHYSMVRSVTGGASATEATTVVNQVAFTYDVQPGATAPAPSVVGTRLVKVDMTYESPQRSDTAGKRTVSFVARLRNVS